MPNYLKPLTTASSAQMRAMLERIISKRKPVAKVPEPSPAMPGAPPPTMEKSAAERILGSGLPFKENEYGRLIDNAIPDKPVPQTLPIQEAMNTYMTNPERYSPAPMSNPVKHVYPGGVGSDSGSLGASIAAERMVFKNPVPPGIRANQASVQRELTGQNIDRGKVGEFEAMVKQKAEGNPKYAMPIGEQLALAARLEDMWRAMDGGSGGRSGAAKLWKAYLDSSNGRDKVRTGKDYFIACALRDQKDPKMMARHYPREKRLLDQMKKSYKEVTGTDLDSGVPAFPEE